MAERNYWRELNIRFPDGTSTTVAVDSGTYRAVVEDNDQAVLTTIIQNFLKSCEGQSTPTPVSASASCSETASVNDKPLNESESRQSTPTQVSASTSCSETASVNDKPLNESESRQSTPTPVSASTSCSETASVNDQPLNESESSDVEVNKDTYTFWPRQAIELLITLYKEHESDMENPRKRKKDVWKTITEALDEAGFHFTQNKVECKWRNLIQSHKEIRDNKKKTGQKRKSFQYFDEIEDIIGRRHDINPPYTSGSMVSSKTKPISFCTKTVNKDTSPTQQCSGVGSLDLSTSIHKSNKLKGNVKKQGNDDGNEILQFLENMEETRKAEHRESERKKDERAKERNSILKDMIKALEK